MATYIYRIQPTRVDMLSGGPTEQEAARLAEHFSYLDALTQSGQVSMAGRTLVENEDSFGIVVFTAESEQEATMLAENDPAIKHGVMTYELFPFRVALWSKDGPEEN